jgi:hypothetical protein
MIAAFTRAKFAGFGVAQKRRIVDDCATTSARSNGPRFENDGAEFQLLFRDVCRICLGAHVQWETGFASMLDVLADGFIATR